MTLGVPLPFLCNFIFEERDSRTYFLETFEANKKGQTSPLGSLRWMGLQWMTTLRSHNTNKQIRASQVGSSAPNIPKGDIVSLPQSLRTDTNLLRNLSRKSPSSRFESQHHHWPALQPWAFQGSCVTHTLHSSPPTLRL